MADAEGRRGSRAGQGARMQRAVCAGAPTWTSTSSFPEASHLPHALLLQSPLLPIPSTDSVTHTSACVSARKMRWWCAGTIHHPSWRRRCEDTGRRCVAHVSLKLPAGRAITNARETEKGDGALHSSAQAPRAAKRNKPQLCMPMARGCGGDTGQREKSCEGTTVRAEVTGE